MNLHPPELSSRGLTGGIVVCHPQGYLHLSYSNQSSMAEPKDPTYFQIPTLNSKWMQAIPVGWHVRTKHKDGSRGERIQRLAITVEAIAGWIKAMQKVNAPKTLYPLIQAKNETFDASRVTKRGHPLYSSLVFMDFDGHLTDEGIKTLIQTFDEKNLGCTFRSFTEGRAKVAFVVDGVPSHQDLKEFIEKMYFKSELLKVGIPPPDTTPQALTTAFIPSEEVLWRLTRSLMALRVQKVHDFNQETRMPSAEEIRSWSMQGSNPMQVPHLNPQRPEPEPPQEPIFDGEEIDLFEVEGDEGFEDEENILFIPYITPVDLTYLQASWGADVSHKTSRLDAIQLGGGWVTGWSDYEGPLPSWMLDKDYAGSMAINPMSVDGKFLRWLLGNAKALCEAGIDIPQKDLADYLEVSQPAISKSISKFVGRGWLSPIPHTFPTERNTDLEALAKVQGLVWNPVLGEGGEVIGVDLHGHWSYPRSVLITAAMGYVVGPKAMKFRTDDLGLRFVCLEILKNQGREKTLEIVEKLLGPPENQIINAGQWQEGLWSLMMTGHFQSREVWYEYCSRIPGIHDEANSSRLRKLDLIWCWAEEHWPSIQKG